MATITIELPEEVDKEKFAQALRAIPAEVLAAALLNILLHLDEEDFKDSIRERMGRWVKSTL